MKTIAKSVEIRFMIRRDMASVMSIESRCFEHAWEEDSFLFYLRQQDRMCMVAELDGKVVGYMVYWLAGPVIQVSRFAVDPEFQRNGIGYQMARCLIEKVERHKYRKKASIYVRESNLDAQLFFRRVGFLAVRTLRSWFDETGESAYQFVYTKGLRECY